MIYFFDGSKDAFLTAFVRAYRDGAANLTTGNCQLTLGQGCIFVTSDKETACRCAARLTSFDKDCMHDLSLLLRSKDEHRGQIAFAYFKLIALRKHAVRGDFSSDAVVAATECMKRVTYEVHRFKGFVRFMECEIGALYAPISPDNDIVELLMPHFCSRLPKIPFVIHDVQRAKAAVWDGNHVFTAPLSSAEIVLSADENDWQALWRRYYDSVNIPSRERIRQMKGYMPVRYWKFMPETPSAAVGDLPMKSRSTTPSKCTDVVPRLNG